MAEGARSARRGGADVVELLVDATGVTRSCLVFRIVWHGVADKDVFDRGIRRYPKAAIADSLTKRFADLVYPGGPDAS